jgi:hypothetical protein
MTECTQGAANPPLQLRRRLGLTPVERHDRIAGIKRIEMHFFVRFPLFSSQSFASLTIPSVGTSW